MAADRIPADVLDDMIARHSAAGVVTIGHVRVDEHDLDNIIAATERTGPHPWARKRGDEIVDHITPEENPPWL